MTDAQLWANRFDTRNLIGCSARATTDSKFFWTVVEIGLMCIYYERPSPVGDEVTSLAEGNNIRV